MKVLLDSTVLIDHFNDVSSATRYLKEVAAAAALSVITRAEVLTGFPEVDRAAPRRLLDAFPTLGIDAEVADRAAALRRHHRWKLPDAFQAALAEHHGLRLATRNSRDFPPDRHPFVLVPYEI